MAVIGTFGRRLQAVLLQRCPQCLQGKVFRGWIRMRETCPVCGHRFEREPGYFLGAMYASYFLSIGVLGLVFAFLYWVVFPDWPPEYVVLLAAVPYLALAPWVFRYSRVIWMHIDPPPADASSKRR
jgi:uncharacterized protein (DUF983 family)